MKKGLKSVQFPVKSSSGSVVIINIVVSIAIDGSALGSIVGDAVDSAIGAELGDGVGSKLGETVGS